MIKPERMRFFLIVLILFSAGTLRAQQNHFIYIQSENKQAFYAKVEGKIHSSTASGYLILSKLKSDNYNLQIGFPKNEFPEQNFTVKIENDDLGFSLKNFNDKGWGLFNLQSLNIIYGSVGVKEKDKPAKANDQKSDAFTDMLVQVTGDSSIKDNVAKKEEKKNEIVIKKDSVAEKQNDKKEIVVLPIPVVVPSMRSKITKQTEFSNDDTYSAIYLVEGNSNTNDTVNVIIEFEKEEKKKEPEQKKETVKFLDIEADPKVSKDSVIEKRNTAIVPENKVTTKDSVQTVPKENVAVISKQMSADCNASATEDDFKKLRKKMAAQSNDDAMIYEARKAFRVKCYTTEQIKNLGTLFLTDASKYSFFDAAYAHVSDHDVFPSLADQLKDSYYINRFKAMIK